MTDKLQDTLADIITALQDAAIQVGQVGVEQLPLLVQEYLQWGLVRYSMHLAMNVSLFILLLTLFLKFKPFTNISASALAWEKYNSLNRHHADSPALYSQGVLLTSKTIVGFLCMPFGLMAFFSSFSNLQAVIKILVAPRVYLLEIVKSLT